MTFYRIIMTLLSSPSISILIFYLNYDLVNNKVKMDFFTPELKLPTLKRHNIT